MKLILTRHGQTVENVEGIFMGHSHGTLTEKGREQNRLIAERLNDYKIDVIYSSDLERAAETAKEIAKFHPDVPVHFVKELRERDYGELVGTKISESNFPYIEPKEGESYKQMWERAKNFLDRVLHKHMDDAVLFVGHGAINNALVCVIENKSHEQITKGKIVKNTSISVFEIDEDRNHKIHVYDSAEHLA